MANKPQDDEDEEKTTDVVGGDVQLRGRLSKELEACKAAIQYFSLDWDEFEDLLFVQATGAYDSRNVRVSEGSISSIVIERAARVMAQLPSGTVHALSIQDQGKSLLMNLLLNNYIIPNANEQYDFETKLFLWDLLSNVYGSMPMCYDWSVTDDYTGPDCWLVPIRDFFPQQGRLSISNCDYLYISSFVRIDWLEDLVEEKVKGYDIEAIAQILEKCKGKAVKPKSEDDYLRNNPMFQQRRRATLTDTGEVELVTKYEEGTDGRWITFAPDFDNVVIRNISNPHADSKIPVVLKYALPTLGSIIGLGDMEKGRYMQYAIDTTVNLQIDRQKLVTYPPLKVINDAVAMPTIRFQPGAKMLVESMDALDFLQLPANENGQNILFQMLQGALNNVSGKTQSKVSGENDAANPGKTPQAIKSQNQDQSTRDALDIRFMEKAVGELIGGMVNLVNQKQTDPIELYMFNDEVKQILDQGYDDIKDMVQFPGKAKGGELKDAKAALIKIGPKKTHNEKGYIYKIDAGSMQSEEQDEQHQQYAELLDAYLNDPQKLETLLEQAGMTIDFGELFKKWFISGGTRDWNSILKPLTQTTPVGQMGATNPTAQPPAPTPQPAMQQVPPAAPTPMAPPPAPMPAPAVGGFTDQDIAAAHSQLMGSGVQ